MLKEAHEIIGDCGILIHSDRGFRYRIDSWIKLMEQYGYYKCQVKKPTLLNLIFPSFVYLKFVF